MKCNKKFYGELDGMFAEVEGVVPRQVMLMDSVTVGIEDYLDWLKAKGDEAWVPHFYIAKNGSVYQLGESTTVASNPLMIPYIGVVLESYGAAVDKPNWDKTMWYEYCSNCKYRSLQYWDIYTTKQIEKLERLVCDLNGQIGRWSMDPLMGGKHPLESALNGVPGVYLLGSFIEGSVGCHPMTDLMKAIRRCAAASKRQN